MLLVSNLKKVVVIKKVKKYLKLSFLMQLPENKMLIPKSLLKKKLNCYVKNQLPLMAV